MRRLLRSLPLEFAPPAANHPLTISAFRAWRVREPVSGRRYSVVKLTSQSGATGFGEGGAATASEIVEAKAAVIGRRATDSELMRHALAAIPSMEAASGNAMLDLVSRSKGIPIYQYLGGPTRFKVRLLGQLEGSDEAGMAAPLERARRQGIRAFTLPVPPREAMMRLQDWVDSVRKRLADMQARAGEGAEWVLDGAAALTPGDAATVAVALERSHPIWFDEPIAALSTETLAKIVDQSVMPIGVGRKVTDIAVFQNLLRFGSVQILRPGLGLNSITKIKRMAAIAESHYVAIAPYHGGGPIGVAAGIHLAAALPNSYLQEVPVPASDRDAAMRAEVVSGNRESGENGFALLLNRPGLGFEVNERALDAYSEERV
jgi:galactonate dehydratase